MLVKDDPNPGPYRNGPHPNTPAKGLAMLRIVVL